MIKGKLMAVILAVITALVCCSCSEINQQQNNTHTYSANVAFEEIFYEFNDVKLVSSELAVKNVDDEWWQRFDSIFGNVNALYYANFQAVNSNQLSENDAVLSKSLTGVLTYYKDAFDVMSASRHSNDSEIINYAYNEFNAKIIRANEQWDQAVASILTNSATSNSEET